MTKIEIQKSLWRAIKHLQRYQTITLNDIEAAVIIRRAICQLNNHSFCSCR